MQQLWNVRGTLNSLVISLMYFSGISYFCTVMYTLVFKLIRVLWDDLCIKVCLNFTSKQKYSQLKIFGSNVEYIHKTVSISKRKSFNYVSGGFEELQQLV